MLRRVFSHTDVGSTRAIVAGFALAMLSFSASLLLSWRAVAMVGSEADAISTNVLPSVVTISDARTSLRELDVGLQELADEASTDHDVAAAVRARSASLRRLEEDVERYFQQPVFPGEDEAWPRIRREVSTLHAAVARLIQAASAHRGDVARSVFRTDVTQASEHLDALLQGVVVFHAEQSTAAAARIGQAFRSATAISLALGGMSVLFSLALLVFVLRTHAGFADLTARHSRLLSERAAELDAFSQRVAHDVKSPLAAVGLAFDIALKHRASDQGFEALARGKRGVARVIEVVDGLYAFARAAASPDLAGRADAQQVVLGVVDDVRAMSDAAAVEVRAELAPVEDVRCPPGVLAVLVGNLVQNAIRHMGAATTRRVTVRLADGKDVVRLEVEDSGPGIPPELGDTLFKPYARGDTSSPGLGLGLATVKRLVEAYGGAVAFRSSHGAGTTFSLTLPKAEPRAPREGA